MEKLEFLEFVPTPQERHKGVATIKVDGKYILRFKILEGKNGKFFPASASFKIPQKDSEGRDIYLAAVEPLHNKKEIQDFIMDNIIRISSTNNQKNHHEQK